MLSNFIFDNVLTSHLWNIYNSLSCDLLSNFIFDNVLTRSFLSLFVDISCDLLSNFIFDNVLTSAWQMVVSLTELWFAFKFYLWQRSYKTISEKKEVAVLWFAFKFYLWQRSYKLSSCFVRLLFVVICFQILSLTTFLQDIDRKYYSNVVVICFQILSLTTFLQEKMIKHYTRYGCDLLSNFIFDNVLTSFPVKDVMSQQFMLCLRF